MDRSPYDAVIQRVKTLRDDGDLYVGRAWDFVARNYPEETEGGRRFMHEVLAQIGQNADITQRSWWKQILELTKRFLIQKFGFTGFIKYSDIQDMVLHSLKVAAKPNPTGPKGGVNPLAQAFASEFGGFSAVDTKSPEFKRWFGDWEIAALEKSMRYSRGSDQARKEATAFIGKPLKNRETGVLANQSISSTLFSRAVREDGIPPGASRVLSSAKYDTDTYKGNPDYEAAKGGDIEAARRFVLAQIAPSTYAKFTFGRDATHRSTPSN